MWFNIPSITDIIASTSPTAGLMLASLMEIMYFVLAIMVAVGAALFIKNKLGGGISRVLKGKRGGRRRRR